MPNIKHLYPPPTPLAPMTSTATERTTTPPTQAQLRELLRRAVTQACDYDTMKTIIRRLADEARVGNQGAAKLLIELYTGKPETEQSPNTTKVLTPTEIDSKLKELGYERKH